MTVRGKWIVLRSGDKLVGQDFVDCIIERVPGDPLVLLQGCNFVDCTMVGFSGHPFTEEVNANEASALRFTRKKHEPEVARANLRRRDDDRYHDNE